MSSATKRSILRIITPSGYGAKLNAVLGPSAKVESHDVVLTADRMTTEDVVRNIRALSRIRDDVLHTLRQFGISREPRLTKLERQDFEAIVGGAQKQLESQRAEYQETQTRIENLERQVEEARKQIGRLSEVVEAGFTSGDALSRHGAFNRVLGRIPVRNLEAAQRSLLSAVKDQFVLATGARRKDWVYVLLAVPTEKTPQALQALILHDFVQTDIPPSEEPDLKKAVGLWEEKKRRLEQELEAARDEMNSRRKNIGESMNQLADEAQDNLMLLRAVLKMGEGARASRSLAWLDKTPSTKVIGSLLAQGMLLEME